MPTEQINNDIDMIAVNVCVIFFIIVHSHINNNIFCSITKKMNLIFMDFSMQKAPQGGAFCRVSFAEIIKNQSLLFIFIQSISQGLKKRGIGLTLLTAPRLIM